MGIFLRSGDAINTAYLVTPRYAISRRFSLSTIDTPAPSIESTISMSILSNSPASCARVACRKSSVKSSTRCIPSRKETQNNLWLESLSAKNSPSPSCKRISGVCAIKDVYSCLLKMVRPV